MSKEKKKSYLVSLATPARLMYPHLDKPDTEGKFPTRRYVLTAVYEDEKALAPIKQAIDACAKSNGAEPDYSCIKTTKLENGVAIKPRTKKKEWLTLLDEFGDKVAPDVITKKFYAGCYVKLKLTVYHFVKTYYVEIDGEEVEKTKDQFGLGLNTVKFAEDGERLGGSDAEEFGDAVEF